jgi:hypothetical protein
MGLPIKDSQHSKRGHISLIIIRGLLCSSGDRPFLKRVDIHPADFLREVWAARDDDRKIIEYVKKQAPKI